MNPNYYVPMSNAQIILDFIARMGIYFLLPVGLVIGLWLGISYLNRDSESD